jgi:hypothetical protein
MREEPVRTTPSGGITGRPRPVIRPSESEPQTTILTMAISPKSEMPPVSWTGDLGDWWDEMGLHETRDTGS